MGLMHALLPPRCAYCGASGVSACAACVHELPWAVEPQPHEALDRCVTAFRLQVPVQAQIHALKYRAELRHAHLLGGLMAQRIARRPQPLPQILIPVPLHRARLRARGFNQSLEIARAMTQVLHLRLWPRAVQRVRDTEDQIGKTAAERRRNVRGAFAVTAPLTGLHIALVDDVMTTGATVAELAKVCRAAGAVRIEAWALAQAPLADASAAR